MDIIREKLDLKKAYPLLPEEYLGNMTYAVLDIETLGLSPAKSPAILVGIADPVKSEAVQLFVEDVSDYEDEKLMLMALEDMLKGYDIVVTYNGRAFDLPYLEKRREKVGLPPMEGKYNLDIFRMIKDFSDLKKFLPNLKQKTVEAFAGLWEGRTDEISGAESIDLYYEFLANPLSEARDKVLLHNRDDIVQLLMLTEILKKVNLERAFFSLGLPVKHKNLYVINEFGFSKYQICIAGRIFTPHEDYAYYGDDFDFRVKGNGFELCVPCLVRQDLTLIDMRKLPFDINEEDAIQGYLVLKNKKDIDFALCNRFAKAILERIDESWITEK